MKNTLLCLLLSFILILNFNKLFAEDALTIKQQLDRIMEEVKDLNKAVKRYSDKVLKSHLNYCITMIDDAMKTG